MASLTEAAGIAVNQLNSLRCSSVTASTVGIQEVAFFILPRCVRLPRRTRDRSDSRYE